jgi:hypothetical protein
MDDWDTYCGMQEVNNIIGFYVSSYIFRYSAFTLFALHLIQVNSAMEAGRHAAICLLI